MSFQDWTDVFTDLVNLPRISNIGTDVTETGNDVRQIAQESGDEIMRRVEWPQLLTEVVVANGITTIALPAEFHRLVAGGAVNLGVGDGRFIKPVTSQDQANFLTHNTSTQAYYFMSGGSIEFIPATPALGAIYQYVSAYWVNLNGSTPDRTLSNANDTVTAFPESLIVKGMVWRWRRKTGLTYADQIAEFEADLLTESNAAKGVSV